MCSAIKCAAPSLIQALANAQANQLRTEMEENRLRFRTEGAAFPSSPPTVHSEPESELPGAGAGVEPVTLRGEGAPEGQDMEIALTPLQIRTFILHY